MLSLGEKWRLCSWCMQTFSQKTTTSSKALSRFHCSVPIQARILFCGNLRQKKCLFFGPYKMLLIMGPNLSPLSDRHRKYSQYKVTALKLTSLTCQRYTFYMFTFICWHIVIFKYLFYTHTSICPQKNVLPKYWSNTENLFSLNSPSSLVENWTNDLQG